MSQNQISIAGVASAIEVVICDELPHEMIIGDPSLRRVRAVIDLC